MLGNVSIYRQCVHISTMCPYNLLRLWIIIRMPNNASIYRQCVHITDKYQIFRFPRVPPLVFQSFENLVVDNRQVPKFIILTFFLNDNFSAKKITESGWKSCTTLPIGAECEIFFHFRPFFYWFPSIFSLLGRRGDTFPPCAPPLDKILATGLVSRIFWVAIISNINHRLFPSWVRISRILDDILFWTRSS